MRAAATYGPGLIALVIVIAPLIFAPWDEVWDVYAENVGTFFVVPFIGVGLLAHAARRFALSRRERPSDLLFEEDGLRVEGGEHDGLFLSWASFSPDDVRLHGTYVKDLKLIRSDEEEVEQRDNFWTLEILFRSGGRIPLASAEDPPERESLVALQDAIKASVARHRHDKGADDSAIGALEHRAYVSSDRSSEAHALEARDDPPGLLRCPTCNAVVAPADAEAVTCEACGSSIAMPTELRERLHALIESARSERENDALIASLIRQPGAKRTGITIALAAIPAFLLWPFAGGVALTIYFLGLWRPISVEMALVIPFAGIAGLFYLVRGQLTDRQAFRLLSLHFAASAPTRAGAPHTCRQCGAELIEPDEAVVVACLYCGADNILGLDRRQAAKEAHEETVSLKETLAQRRASHRRWRMGKVWAILLLGLAAMAFSMSLRPPRSLRTTAASTALTRITYNPLEEFLPEVSPDGRQLLYHQRVHHKHRRKDARKRRKQSVMLIGCDGAFRGLELTAAVEQGHRPVWLPSGRGFLYVARRKNGEAILRRVDSLRPRARGRVLVQAGYNIEASVSPTGQALVFASAPKRRGPWTIYRSDMEGGHRRRVTRGFTPRWDPRGREIVFTRKVKHRNQIFILDMHQGARPKRITRGRCHHELPAWSPDGTHLAFVSNCGLPKWRWGIFIMRRDGSEVVKLTEGDADVMGVTWWGPFLYFSSNVAGNYDIWRIRLRGRVGQVSSKG